jgi:hypothetical protein
VTDAVWATCHIPNFFFLWKQSFLERNASVCIYYLLMEIEVFTFLQKDTFSQPFLYLQFLRTTNSKYSKEVIWGGLLYCPMLYCVLL